MVKIKEFVNYKQQIAKPQSSGSRGMRHFKKTPPKRYFDYKNKK